MAKRPRDPQNPSRRRFLGGLAAASGAALLPGCGSDGGGGGATGDLPNPEDSGIDNIVVVMMENRSFDHFLGWVPGADGIQAGLQYPDNDGVMHETFRLSQVPEYGWQGCGFEDPEHGYDGGRTHYNNGAMDGFLKTVGGAGDLFPIGYYTAEDVPFYKGAAENFTICDRYFTGIFSQTFPNRVYMHAGQSDRNSNTLPYAQQPPSTLMTIWDLLAARGVSRGYYFYDLPFLGLWGPKYLDISYPYQQFLVDAALGTLPSVSFIDPFFGGSLGEGVGISRDDHPFADIRDGQEFLAQIYNALRNSSQWENTLLIINYDEWGGFYDHVPPPMGGPITPEEFAATGNDGRLGIRVPCVLIGPRARKAHVAHEQLDTNSILNFIRWRFGLDALVPRDTTSLNLAHALDFSSINTSAPDFNVPTSPAGFGVECNTGLPFPLPNPPLSAKALRDLDPIARSRLAHYLEWDSLRQLARATGWKI